MDFDVAMSVDSNRCQGGASSSWELRTSVMTHDLRQMNEYARDRPSPLLFDSLDCIVRSRTDSSRQSQRVRTCSRFCQAGTDDSRGAGYGGVATVLNLDAVGASSDPVHRDWNQKDALLYALGVG